MGWHGRPGGPSASDRVGRRRKPGRSARQPIYACVADCASACAGSACPSNPRSRGSRRYIGPCGPPGCARDIRSLPLACNRIHDRRPQRKSNGGVGFHRRSARTGRRPLRPRVQRRSRCNARPRVGERRARPNPPVARSPGALATTRRPAGERSRGRSLPALSTSPACSHPAAACRAPRQRPTPGIDRPRRRSPPSPRPLDGCPRAGHGGVGSRIADAVPGHLAENRREQAEYLDRPLDPC